MRGNRQLHIVVLPSWYPGRLDPINGIFVLEQVRALQRNGVRVGVVYPELLPVRKLSVSSLANRFKIEAGDESQIPTMRFRGLSVSKLPRLSGKLFISHSLKLIRRYVCIHGKPDVIHAHSALWGGVAAGCASRREGIPFLLTEHSTAFMRGLRRWEEVEARNAFQGAFRVLAVSQSLAKQIAKLTSWNKIDVLPNMVDTAFFSVPPTHRESDQFCFFTLACLNPRKGVDVLIKAFGLAFGGRASVVLEIGGDGPQRKELELLVSRLGLERQIRFLGLLDRKEVRKAMWGSNSFVLPSYIETFGVVLIEAMSTGLPVIATDCGGPADFVTPDVGTLIAPGDMKRLSEALIYHYRHGDRFNSLLVRKHVVERFSEQAVTAELADHYIETINSNS